MILTFDIHCIYTVLNSRSRLTQVDKIKAIESIEMSTYYIEIAFVKFILINYCDIWLGVLKVSQLYGSIVCTANIDNVQSWPV